MDTHTTSTDARRRHEIGQLTRALKGHLVWQSHLAADGAPMPTAEQLGELAARIEAAQRMKDEAARKRLFAPPSPAPAAPPRAPARPDPVGVEAALDDAPAPIPLARAVADATPEDAERPESDIYLATRLLGSSSELDAVARANRSSSGALDAVQALVGDCQRCKLARARTRLVFGAGDPTSDLIFVGEAPGFTEDRQGQPFVGRAGPLLSRMIAAMGYRREEVYICNVLMCRPPGSRYPEPEEIQTCKPFLIEQIKAIEPRVIVALGDCAAKTLLRESAPIEELRGKWFTRQGIRIMPTLHPSHLMRVPEDKRLVWSDLQKVMTALGRR